MVGLLRQRLEMLSAKYATISGRAGSWGEDLGLNSREAAGRTVFHAQWHLIARRAGRWIVMIEG